MRHKTNGRVDEEMRLQKVVASPVDGSMIIDGVELRNSINRAVNDDLKRAVAVDQTGIPLRARLQKAASRTAKKTNAQGG